MNKPRCKLIGTDGNIFALMGRVSKTLREAGLEDKVTEMQNRVTSSQSYDEALCVLNDYVEVC
jgi:hypothetical protein